MAQIPASDRMSGIPSTNIEPPTRSLRPGSTKPIDAKPVRLETRWRAIDPHLNQYCHDLAAQLLDSDGRRQRAPRADALLKFERAVEVIVCNFVALATSSAGNRPLAIIRANHASSISPVYGKPFNRAVALMVDIGLLTMKVGYRHDRWSRMPSSITRTPALVLPVLRDWSGLSLEDHEHLIVLNEDKSQQREPSQPLLQWFAELVTINARLCMANIEMRNATHIASWSGTVADRLITPHHRHLHRVFNGTFERGGRLYGGWWQTLPREHRKHIRIDGESAVNVDYSTLHLRLAYAEAGCEPPHGDLYDLTGHDHERSDWQILREGRKRLVSAVFTSKRRLRQWPGATHAERESIRSCFPNGAKVREEVAAIRHRHHAIAHDWLECGQGMRLQRLESDILVAVLLKLGARGIAALPIHDSVLVARSRGGTARRIMEAEALAATGAGIPAKVSG